MSTICRNLAIAFTASMLTLLSSCGSEQVAGIEGSGSPVASAVTTSGRITGFGSIIVDDIEYATSGAQIRIDDRPATESELRVGHVITIKGTVNPDGRTGTASEVTLTSDVRGDVGGVDLQANTFQVLGQTVKVSEETLFDESTQAQDLSQLKAGVRVRVSGFPSSGGVVLASRVDGIQTAAAAPDVQVSGKVGALDTTAQTFRVNGLVVDYRSATVSGTLANGSTATVRGTSATDGNTLVATQVTVTPETPAPAGEKGQLEGLITAFTSNSDFIVDGQRITANSSTQYDLRGISLGVDVFVKVRGTYNNTGVLLADKVEAKESPVSLAKGIVGAVSGADGTLSLIGVNVRTSASTAFEDRTNDKKRQFRLADVRVGDYVEVRGNAAPGAPLSATVLQRLRPEERSYLQGAAQDISPPTLKVLGVTVMTDAGTSFPGFGSNEKGAEEFFAQAADRIVSVRGRMNGDVLVADQIRIDKN